MRLYDNKELWRMSEPNRVVAIIQDVGLWNLGNWDGCCCSHFSIRNVDIDISCGKGREQAVWVSSRSMDYDEPLLLEPIMKEVVYQLERDSNRGGTFAEYYVPWKKK